ncbi:hypothetical protein HWV62_29458 [Athelia sp. TMB]|nr:hypothetical protein HWV62_29458 [Athelia sp. TMB]
MLVFYVLSLNITLKLPPNGWVSSLRASTGLYCRFRGGTVLRVDVVGILSALTPISVFAPAFSQNHAVLISSGAHQGTTFEFAGLNEIGKIIGDHGIRADLWAREIDSLEGEGEDTENARSIRANRRNLENENEAIADLENPYDQVTKSRSNISSHCSIGYVPYAADITVETYPHHTHAPNENKPTQGPSTPFKTSRRYSILWVVGRPSSNFPSRGCATKEQLAKSAEFDSEGQRCLIVGQDGSAADLTVGRYAGLVSFTRNEFGVESAELGIYNSGVKNAEAFSANGDSGSLVFHTVNGKARIVGQLHPGNNKGSSTSNHVIYCTPGWYLLDQISKKFHHADFYRTTWST